MPICYSKHENYFQVINTAHKAYFLGLLFADGNVYHRPSTGNGQVNKVSIALEETDKHILESLNREIYITPYPLKYLAARQLGKYTSRPQWLLNIFSQQIASDLIRHGCVPRKAATLRFPSESVSPNLIPHFIRGYFDGDGCIALCKRNYKESIYEHYTVSMSMKNSVFADEMKNVLKELGIDFHHGKYVIDILSIGKREAIKRFFDIIYPAGCLCLKRKLERFHAFTRYNESRTDRVDSPFKNVSRSNKGYWAKVKIDKVEYPLGYFKDAEAAALTVQMFREFHEKHFTG